jgi:hypothetical protein
LGNTETFENKVKQAGEGYLSLFRKVMAAKENTLKAIDVLVKKHAAADSEAALKVPQEVKKIVPQSVKKTLHTIGAAAYLALPDLVPEATTDHDVVVKSPLLFASLKMPWRPPA